MSIFSEGRPRISLITTILSLVIIIVTNPILVPIKSLDFLFFFESLSNLANGWFILFYQFSFFCKNSFIQIFKSILETLHLIIVGLALFLLFLTFKY